MVELLLCDGFGRVCGNGRRLMLSLLFVETGKGKSVVVVEVESAMLCALTPKSGVPTAKMGGC